MRHSVLQEVQVVGKGSAGGSHDAPTQADSAASGAGREAEVVPCLTRAPSREEASEYFSRYEGLELAKARWRLALARLEDACLWVFGDEGGAHDSLKLGYDSVFVGDFGAARRYLWEEVEAEHEDLRLGACMLLLYLEDDPRICTHLLQSVCETDAVSLLTFAIKFCDEMESEDLRNYYLQRLRAAAPEHAEDRPLEPTD